MPQFLWESNREYTGQEVLSQFEVARASFLLVMLGRKYPFTQPPGEMAIDTA
jgi:hypothetical protein